MLEILVFLFQNFSKTSLGILVNAETLSLELEQIGCHPQQVQAAFTWLKTVAEMLRQNKRQPQEKSNSKSKSIRIYTADECRRLSIESRGLLLFLEEHGVIGPLLRECIIERTLALDSFAIDIEQMKWVITIIILNSQAQQNLMKWLDKNDKKLVEPVSSDASIQGVL